jgi:hypothetical protein
VSQRPVNRPDKSPEVAGMKRTPINPCYLGASGEPAGHRGLQQLSELREGHVVWDEASTATGKAFLGRVANDVSGVRDGLDEAPTAALLTRHLDGDRQLGRGVLSTMHLRAI